MEEEKTAIDTLEENVQLLRKEVSALQINAMNQKTPWYRSISTLISVLALVFSFGTTYFSYTRTKSQDIQNTRAELRNLLQRLSSLSREEFEVKEKYQKDPNTIAHIGSFITGDTTLLSRQAAELTKRLPKDYVSSTEYSAIGESLVAVWDYEGAKEFIGYAVASANNFNDKVAALRNSGNLMFLVGRPKEGRVEYQKALNVFSEFPGYNDQTIGSTHIQTELDWISSETDFGFKDLANQHISNAESYLTGLSPGPETDQLKILISNARQQLRNDKKPADLPRPDTGGAGRPVVPTPPAVRTTTTTKPTWPGQKRQGGHTLPKRRSTR